MFMKQLRFLAAGSLFLIVLWGCAVDQEEQGQQQEDLHVQGENPIPPSPSDAIYELSLSELMAVNLVPDTFPAILLDDYDLSIQDLMALEIVNELEIDTALTVTYDIPLEDLMKIHITRAHRQNQSTLNPTYEISLEGLQGFELVQRTNIKQHFKLTYDISLDGLMRVGVYSRDTMDVKN